MSPQKRFEPKISNNRRGSAPRLDRFGPVTKVKWRFWLAASNSTVCLLILGENLSVNQSGKTPVAAA